MTGIDLGALIRGTAGGITGYEQGKRQAADAAYKMRLQLLQESLTRENIDRLRAQTRAAEAKPYTTEITDEEWQGFTADKPQLKGIPRAARLKVLEQWSGSQFKAPENPDFQLVQDANGNYVWVRKPSTEPTGAAGTPAGAGPVTPGVAPQGSATPGATPIPRRPQGVGGFQYGGPGARTTTIPTGIKGPRAAEKPPTDKQIQQATYGANAGWSDITMREIGQRNYAATQEAARALASPAIANAILGGARGQALAAALREAGLSDDATQYLNATLEFAGNAAPARFSPGALRSPLMLQQMWSEFATQMGEPRAGLKIKERNRRGLLLAAKQRAGKQAWTDALALRGITEDQLFGTGEPDDLDEAQAIIKRHGGSR